MSVYERLETSFRRLQTFTVASKRLGEPVLPGRDSEPGEPTDKSSCAVCGHPERLPARSVRMGKR